MIWAFILLTSVVVGATCAFTLARTISVISAALIPWILFLAFNLVAEYSSPDKELMVGTWLFFQFTLGLIPSIVAVTAWWVTNKLRGNSEL